MCSSDLNKIVVAGHQPNFFPWFGYFEKMLNADIFVFSDDVRFPKRNYVNRVEIPTRDGSHQWCLPVLKGNDGQIAYKAYIKDQKTLGKILKTVRYNMSHLPRLKEIEPFLEQFEDAFNRHETLADLNIEVIQAIALEFGIKTRTCRGTELGLEKFRSTDRLIRRMELLNAGVYLSGRGADDYTDKSAFEKANRKLTYVEYKLGHHLFGDNLRFSILAGIATVGLAKIRDGIEHELENKKLEKQ